MLRTWPEPQPLQPLRPKVGLGVIVVKDGKVLVGKRRGSHGEGQYAFPGGHLEWFETYKTCAEREVLEETGMAVDYRPLSHLQPQAFVTNNHMAEDHKHYITIYVVCDWQSGEPVNTQPDKCSGWEWVTFDQLPFNEQWLPRDLIEYRRTAIGI
jgi:8-oxo-dGTP diphosphatase